MDEIGNIKAALKPVCELYELTPAEDFRPLELRAVRDRMIARGWARTTINHRLNRVRRAFRWAASMEMVPVAVVASLETVDGLQGGHTSAREKDPFGPVPVAIADATIPHLPRQVAALVRVRLLTGMRPAEVCAIRGRDLGKRAGEPTWTYHPASHKTAWRGKVRSIAVGPKAQAVLDEFARPDPDDYLFDPRDAVAEHHAARAARRKSKLTPSELAKRKPKPGCEHARRYNRPTHRNAISRACDKVFPHPELSAIPRDKLTAEQAAELWAWREARRWHPNQLRPTFATEVRASHGLEAAQAILGHSNADTTQIYAERDLTRARSVIREVG